MASRGFLIRFIDIGLIVLFGFLMISDIDRSARVELADTAAEPDTVEEQEEERAFVLVAIGPDGAYRVSDPRSEEEPVIASGPVELGEELTRRKELMAERSTDVVVLLQPDPASLVQHTVDAMDVCDRLALAKSLRMDIEVVS